MLERKRGFAHEPIIFPKKIFDRAAVCRTVMENRSTQNMHDTIDRCGAGRRSVCKRQKRYGNDSAPHQGRCLRSSDLRTGIWWGWRVAVWILVILGAISCLPPSVCRAEALLDEELIALYEQVESDGREVDEDHRVAVDKSDLAVQDDLPEEWWNILLLGTDTDGKLNYGRTDAMLIVSIQARTGEVKLTSLVRDMWVDIPGLRLPNRINAANAFGGPYLAVKTVNSVFDMNIRHYCSINFSGMERLVDLVGGVSLEMTPSEAYSADARLRDGVALLNGQQALAYARIRKLDNNFGRNERQRKLLEALLRKVTQTRDMAKLLIMINEMLPYVSTNLDLSELVSLAGMAVKHKDLSLDTLSLPQPDDFHYDSADGRSKVIFDRDATVSALHAFVYGQDKVR